MLLEWLTLIATFIILYVADYAFLNELTVQITLLSGALLVLGVMWWVAERISIVSLVKSN